MPQVSRRPIRKETVQKINNLFWESLALCSKKGEISEFLEDLLTPTEKIMLSKRLAIGYLLLKGYPYDVINTTLKVSKPTIGSVSLILNTKGNGLRKVLQQIGKRKKPRGFLKELVETTIDLIAQGKGGNWKIAKAMERQRKMEKQSPL